MPTTPRLALPYPTPDDQPLGPAQIQALADRLDLLVATDADVDKIAPTYVVAPATLPASPFEAQEVYYNTGSCVWHLVYLGATAGAYKWHYLGGAPLISTPPGVAIGAGHGEWVDGNGPAITVPLGGDYDLAFTVNVGPSGASPPNNYTWYSRIWGGVEYLGSVVAGPAYGGPAHMMGGFVRRAGIAAGQVVKVQYMNEHVQAQFSSRSLSICPARVV